VRAFAGTLEQGGDLGEAPVRPYLLRVVAVFGAAKPHNAYLFAKA